LISGFPHAVVSNLAPGDSGGFFGHRRRAWEARVMIMALFLILVLLLLIGIGIFVRRAVFK
jgi:hypothetical protein